jgi:acyl dehydratase
MSDGAEARGALGGYEAVLPGQVGVLGTVQITREDVVRFAAAWDPQPFHLDEAAGLASPLGGHAASGWHTASLLMRLIADGLLAGLKSMGSGGVKDLKWLKPVLIGDRLTARYLVLGVRPSSRSDRGYAETAFTMVNQRGEPVLTMTTTIILGR